MDSWQAPRTREEYYRTELAGVRGLLEVWSVQEVTPDVHESETLWTSRRLHNDYRTVNKANNPLWSDAVRFEQQIRSEVGLFVMYHHLEVESWSPSETYGPYVPLFRWWDELEVPPGF